MASTRISIVIQHMGDLQASCISYALVYEILKVYKCIYYWAFTVKIQSNKTHLFSIDLQDMKTVALESSFNI